MLQGNNGMTMMMLMVTMIFRGDGHEGTGDLEEKKEVEERRKLK